MSTLDDLLTKFTKSEALDRLLAWLRLGELPVASWQPFSLPRHLTDAFAEFLGDISEGIVNVAKMGLNGLAEKGWLDLASEDFYENARQKAIRTAGYVTFTDSASAGPFTKAAGEVWFELGGKRFVNTAGFTCPLNGSIARIACRAESAGAAWNVPLNSAGKLVTGIPGLAVSNPDPGDNDGTWITTQGTDDEEDDDLRARNTEKWGTLSAESTDTAPDDAYVYWAKHASVSGGQVTRATVITNQPGGQVTVLIAGPAGAVSQSVVTAVRTFLVSKVRGNTALLDVINATNYVQLFGGTLYVLDGVTLETALAGAGDKLRALCSTTDIGAKMYGSAIVEAVKSVSGVYNFVPSSPALGTDIFPGTTSVFATPDVSGLVAVR